MSLIILRTVGIAAESPVWLHVEELLGTQALLILILAGPERPQVLRDACQLVGCIAGLFRDLGVSDHQLSAEKRGRTTEICRKTHENSTLRPSISHMLEALMYSSTCLAAW